jgi:hypothetical protein
MWIVGCWVLLALACEGSDQWFLLPEPKFMGHKVVQPIQDAKSTVLAPARGGEFGVDFPSAEEWKTAGITDEALTATTRAAAAQWLKELKPVLVRGPDKVVQYAQLHSDKVPVCATVLAPEFLRRFEDIFGPKPLVVMPNRHTVFVFPGLAGKHERFAPVVLAAWQSDAPRVSLEVFELGAKGLRAVGTFEE